MNTDKALMGEEVNWKKLLLFFFQKSWIIIIAGVAGAVIGSSLYLLITAVFSGPVQYTVDGGFYIKFADGMLEAHDYYNAYTWNSVIHQDQIMDATMAALAQASVTEIDREYVSESMTADILSDVRYLTLKVTCDRPDYATQIFDACEYALEQFGQNMEEFEAIYVTHQPQPEEVVLPDLSWRAIVIGATIGLILAIFIFILGYIMDDSIYLQEELQNRYHLFVFGSLPKQTKNKKTVDMKWEAYCLREFESNLVYKLTKGDAVAFIPVKDMISNQKRAYGLSLWSHLEEITIENLEMPQNSSAFEKARTYKGIILGVPYGSRNGKLLQKYIMDLQKQDCNILGAVLVEADGNFQRKYYQSCFKRGKEER